MRFAANISRMKTHDFLVANEGRKLKAIEAQLRTVSQSAVLTEPDAAQLARQALAGLVRVRQSIERRRKLLQESADELQVMVSREGREQRVLKQQFDRLGIIE